MPSRSKGLWQPLNSVPRRGSRWRVDELEPGRLIRWTCLGHFPGWTGTTVSWELTPVENGGTAVMFKHEGWAKGLPAEDLASVNYTCGGVVGRLKQHAETGEITPFLG
jgi:hypothetical protein